MFAWIAENIATILICLVLALAVVLIVVKLVRGRKNGCASCGGNCGRCPTDCSCHKQ